MISKFLNAKHWQLFLLIFGLPLITQVVVMVSILASVARSDNPDPSSFFNYMMLVPVLMLVFMGLQFGWFWSMAIGLQHKVPQNVKMKVRKFKTFFFIPLFYIFLISIYMVTVISEISRQGSEPDPVLLVISLLLIIPLHLFSMFSIFYSIYFVAKTLKTIELQRETRFSDFVGEFFMVWFYPVGIWFIQPKVNAIIRQ